MDETKATKQDSLPKIGRVNEMCREWLVREDGALAYRLQSQEISEHYTGNKSRNAQVREDFPCALDEQIREQQLAEQAAAVYQKMLAEQEELDQQIAKQLAEKLEIEERSRIRQDENVAKQIFVEEKISTFKSNPHPLPPKPTTLEHKNVYENFPRRSKMMPLPNETDVIDSSSAYSEPYRGYLNLEDHFERIDLADVGVPIDEVAERRIQEERDAELARQLQEMETSSEEFKINRDRMLAMEAQDKELAKLLQERERAKVKRAKERARQKALAKKQAEQNTLQELMPDDSYSNPIDLIPHSDEANYSHVINTKKGNINIPEESNYSFPVDAVPRNNYDSKQSPLKKIPSNFSSPNHRYEKINGDNVQPIRPNQLDLRSPLNVSVKSKTKEPDMCETTSNISPLQHKNIAIAIDPTYSRRNIQSPPSYDTSSSTMTSTLSSSPGLLPSPDISEDGDVTLPYMPIQGQRRTGSMEKKKKKTKDGCKQQ